MSRSKDRRSLDISGEERSNKCFRIEGSEVYNFNFFSFASQSSINTHSNGQYCCPFIFGKNGRYSKQISDGFEQGNMGLFVKQRDHNYCRISPRVTQCGSRYSIQDSKGCKRVQVKSQNIPEDLQIQGNTRDRSFCFPNLTPITHLHLMEIGPLQPRERWLPNFLDQQKRICLSHILSNRSSLKKDSIRLSNTDSSNPRIANTVGVPSVSTNVNKESLVTSKYSKFFDRAKQTKSSVDRKTKLATPGMDSFREKLSAEELSEESSNLITNARRLGTVSHYELVWRNVRRIGLIC